VDHDDGQLVKQLNTSRETLHVGRKNDSGVHKSLPEDPAAALINERLPLAVHLANEAQRNPMKPSP
jgi:hypothetical protein